MDGTIDPLEMLARSEKLDSVDGNLGAIRNILENAVNDMKTTGQGASTGLSMLRSDIGDVWSGISQVGSAIAPTTSYTSPDIAMRPHYGMFMHNQGLLSSVATSLGIQGSFGPSSPMGIDPYTYKTLSTNMLGKKAEAATAGMLGGAGETIASLGAFAGASSLAGVGAGALGLTGLAAGAMTFGVGIAAGMAFDYAMEKVGPVARYRERAELENVMSRSDWRVASAWGEGDLGGMSDVQRNAVARGIQGLKDRSSWGHDDVKMMFEHGMARGIYDDITSAEGMITRTSEIMRDVKRISNRAHVSLQGAVGVMADLRDMGFSSPAKAMSQFSSYGTQAGYTAMEMMEYGKQGSGMFGYGVDKSVGAMGAAGLIADVKSMQAKGIIDKNFIMQSGGVANLGMMRLQESAAFAASSTFRGLGMAMMGTGGVGDITPGDVGGLMAQDPTQILMSAYASKDGGYSGFVSKAMNYQRNQGDLVNILGAKGLQSVQDLSIAKQVGYLANVAPELMNKDNIGDYVFDIARRSGKSNQSAEILAKQFSNVESFEADMSRANNIEAAKIASEKRESFKVRKKIARGFTSLVGMGYDALDQTIDLPTTGIGELLNNISIGWDNFGVDGADNQKRKLRVTSSEISVDNLKLTDQALSASEVADDKQEMTRILNEASANEDRILLKDVEFMAQDEKRMKRVRGDKSEKEARRITMGIALDAKDGGFNMQEFGKQMGWKDSEGKPLPPEKWSKEQKMYAMNAVNGITSDSKRDKRSVQLRSAAAQQLGVHDNEQKRTTLINDIADLDDELRASNILYDGPLEQMKDEADNVADEIRSFKLGQIIEEDEDGTVSSQMALYLKGDLDKKSFSSVLTDKGVDVGEVEDILKGLDKAKTGANAKDLISEHGKQASIKKRMQRKMFELATSEQLIGKGDREKIKKELDSGVGLTKDSYSILSSAYEKVKGQDGTVSGEEIAQRRNIQSSTQNQINEDLLQAIKLIIKKLEK